MEGSIFVIGIIIVFLLIVGIPIISSIFLYKYLNRKFDGNWQKYLSLIPTLLLIYMVYSAIFPADEFYKEDFKEITKLDFPEQSEILYKTASYPDQFGDYTSVFAVKTTNKNYQKVLNQIRKTGFVNKKDSWYSPETNEALSKANENIKSEYFKEKAGKNYYLAFLKDNKTIILRRISW